MRSQLEISAMRQEVERKLQEKEDEFETTRCVKLRSNEEIEQGLGG